MIRLIPALAAALLLSAAGSADAQTYPNPSRSIRVIAPYGPGQATDLMCRAFVEALKTSLNHTAIVIENRPGAGGNIGGAEAAKSTPDGYTLLCTGNATHIGNPFLYSNMGFEPMTDLVPIVAVAGTGYAVMVGPKHKDKTIAQLVAEAKAKPGQLTVGLASTTAQVVNGMFSDAAKIQLTKVPYSAGNAGLFPDLMRGDTDLVIEAMPSSLARIKEGQVKGLAVTNPTKNPFVPDVPTLAESGIDLKLLGWNAFYAPKGTPAEIVATLNRAANEALKDPTVAQRLATVASEPLGGTPERLVSMINEDRARWSKVIKELGLKAE
jgi:tripartite-type tricarboxylate transporter receptor subunit TctC